MVISGREAFKVPQQEPMWCIFFVFLFQWCFQFTIQSMCKQFLFADSGGYIIYIGATEEIFALSNESLPNEFFRIHDSLKEMGLGMQFRNAVVNSGNSFICYSFLGDPALRFYVKSESISIMSPESEEKIAYCRASGIGLGSYFAYQIVKENITKPIGDTNNQYIQLTTLDSEGIIWSDSFNVSYAAAIENGATLIVYAWNDSVEARGILRFSNSIDTSNIIKKFVGQNSIRNKYLVKKSELFGGVSPDEATVNIRDIKGRKICGFGLRRGECRVKLDRQGVPPGI